MTQCPCGTKIDYSNCCGRYIDNHEIPSTPELLMRSRYTAYSQAKIAYIQHTMRGKPLEGFNPIEAAHWAKHVTWTGLKIVKSSMDDDNDDLGYVEFIASYQEAGKIQKIHEISQFKRYDGKWFYVDGTQGKTRTQAKTKLSRNAPCPCGSQKKYKNCHGWEIIASYLNGII